MTTVRAASAADLPEIGRVQRSANTLYAPYGLAEHLDALSTPREELERGFADRLLWVATDASDTIVGFALASAFGADLHLDEIGVVPSRVRRGVGSSLLAAVMEEGRARAARRLTLLTVDFVPWTLGFYAHHRFTVLTARELDARLVALLAIDRAELPRDARSFDGRVVLARNLQGVVGSVR